MERIGLFVCVSVLLVTYCLSAPARVSNDPSDLASESDVGLELLVASAQARAAKQSTPSQAHTVRPKKTAKEKGPAPAPSDDEDDDCLPPCFGVPAPPIKCFN